MQKTIKIFLCFVLTIFCSVTLTSCKKNDENTYDPDVLRVYNCQDYINEGIDYDTGKKVAPSVMELWEADFERRNPGRDVTIQYDTFETPENMLNQIKTGKQFDLVCPSDYVIQKMVKEDMLEKFDLDVLGQEGGYLDNVSPYLKKLFDDNGWTEYSACYMWGTLGILYNSKTVSDEDVKHWKVMWDEAYKGEMSIKDSVRDTYFMGVMYVYQEQLLAYRDQYLNGEITKDEYNSFITSIANDANDETLEKVESALKELKNNIFGLEVDSGKSDIIEGKIQINLAWSGDAVYAIYESDRLVEKGDLNGDEVELKYYVPDEGANVWYDGWCMPKGANKELAQDFVNFVSTPEIAMLNMDEVMYTSAVASDEIYDFIIDWYGAEDEENAIAVDLTYFFGDSLSEDKYTDGRVIIYTDEVGRMFSTHYPDEETLARCGIMRDFGERNDEVLKLWISFKGNSVSLYLVFTIVAVVGVIALSCYAVLLINKIGKKKRRKSFKTGKR